MQVEPDAHAMRGVHSHWSAERGHPRAAVAPDPRLREHGAAAAAGDGSYAAAESQSPPCLVSVCFFFHGRALAVVTAAAT